MSKELPTPPLSSSVMSVGKEYKSKQNIHIEGLKSREKNSFSQYGVVQIKVSGNSTSVYSLTFNKNLEKKPCVLVNLESKKDDDFCLTHMLKDGSPKGIDIHIQNTADIEVSCFVHYYVFTF